MFIFIKKPHLYNLKIHYLHYCVHMSLYNQYMFVSVFLRRGQLKFGIMIAEANAQLESSSSRNLKGLELQSYQKWLKNPFIVLVIGKHTLLKKEIMLFWFFVLFLFGWKIKILLKPTVS